MKEIINSIKKAKNIAIFGHISPDADCFSSMCSLAYILKNLGKNVDLYDDYLKPKFFMNYYKIGKDINQDINLDANYDLFICVDVSSYKQLGKYAKAFSEFNNTIIIDHHFARDLKSDIEYINPNKSSCSEIILDLAEEMKFKIDENFINLLMPGIITDTNCFQNDNVSEETFNAASKCLKYGANLSEIVYLFMKRTTEEDLKIKKIAYDKMVIKNKIAYVILKKKDFLESGAEDSSNLVNDLLNIDGVNISFVIKQKDRKLYSVSLRCKKGYDVSKIASQFGGGGHIQASGMSFDSAPVKYAKLIYEEALKQISKE